MIQKSLNIIVLLFVLFTGCKQKPMNNEPIDPAQLPMLPCKQVEMLEVDSLKRKIIRESIRFFVGKECFTKDRGIVELFISLDDLGREVWTIMSEIQDVHMWGGTATPVFEEFEGDIVLIYGVNHEAENRKRTKEQKREIGECLDQIIGDRVFQRPTRQDRWTDGVVNGKRLTRGQGRGKTGTICKRIIVFNGDGTYDVLF